MYADKDLAQTPKPSSKVLDHDQTKKYLSLQI